MVFGVVARVFLGSCTLLGGCWGVLSGCWGVARWLLCLKWLLSRIMLRGWTLLDGFYGVLDSFKVVSMMLLGGC